MTAPVKLAGFAVLLALLFGGGALAGDALDADAPEGAKPAASHASEPDEHSKEGEEMSGAHGESHPVRGLAIAEEGLKVEIADPAFETGTRATLRFRIVDAQGGAVRDFDVEHTKRMHVIVVRRDLTGFQHLHPELGDDGTWSTPLRLDAPGSYRVFADFARGGAAYTLASDLAVDGDADLQPLPRPAASAKSDGGHVVALDARGGELRFTITRGGEPVEVEPYLGANGHLVALREGDLAFLHVHPEHEGVTFRAEFPTAGRYRLFLQFQVDGKVETVAFTHEVR